MDQLGTQNPQVAIGAVVIRDGRVLLVKRKNPPSQNLWAIPGGRVKAGEPLIDAVKREILEETGINVKVGQVVHVFDLIESNKSKDKLIHYVIIDYKAEYISGEIKAGDDALDVRWVSGDEIDQIPINDTSLKLLKDKFSFF
jgi:ADP-ribose pyrophosphatase